MLDLIIWNDGMLSNILSLWVKTGTCGLSEIASLTERYALTFCGQNVRILILLLLFFAVAAFFFFFLVSFCFFSPVFFGRLLVHYYLSKSNLTLKFCFGFPETTCSLQQSRSKVCGNKAGKVAGREETRIVI